MNRRDLLRVTLLGGALFASGCGGGSSGGAGVPTAGRGSGVLDVARANNLTAFLRAVETSGLTEQLSGSGPYTLFVPNDAAFRAAGLSPDRDGEALRRLLGYHVVPGHLNSSFMRGMDMNHLTATGDTLNVDGRSGGIRVNGASILRADIAASNGVVHIVDRVLRPA